MKTITIVTPANIEVEYKLAGVGARLAALIIDSLLQFVAIAVCGAVIWAANYQLRQGGVAVRSSIALAVFLLLAFTIYLGYFVVLELTMNGQTIGKRLFGLRVIRDNGQPIEFSQALMRGIIRSSLDMMYIGLFVILFSKKHKRVGDMAAGTIVVIENYDYDFALSIKNWTLPKSFPTFEEMAAEERNVVETWLRRKDELPEQGRELELKLLRHFIKKTEKVQEMASLDTSQKAVH